MVGILLPTMALYFQSIFFMCSCDEVSSMTSHSTILISWGNLFLDHTIGIRFQTRKLYSDTSSKASSFLVQHYTFTEMTFGTMLSTTFKLLKYLDVDTSEQWFCLPDANFSFSHVASFGQEDHSAICTGMYYYFVII